MARLVALCADRPKQDLLMDLLVWAGELECALADMGSATADGAVAFTDAVARAVIGKGNDIAPAWEMLQVSALPSELTLRSPEGFTYYALDPVAYAQQARARVSGPACVVGIRSIGTTLSAVCAAEFDCARMTVRPDGHPYDRELHFSPAQREWVRRHREQTFLIVDEGPGLSGSSFLATAEAVMREGVAASHVVLLGSHAGDEHRLVARDAPRRWRQFTFAAVSRAEAPEGSRPFHGLDWRAEWLAATEEWPATWSQLTPPKYLSIDGTVLWKYEGIGRAGEEVRGRAAALAARGFSPRIVARQHGFTGYEVIENARRATVEDVDVMLPHMADHCAFRAQRFAAGVTDSTALLQMTRHNVQNLLGAELRDDFALPVEQVAVCDARMMPHEWLLVGDGRVLKTDAVMHGDDHFFPGPADIAWDIAGVIAEWELANDRALQWIEIYEKVSGDGTIAARAAAYQVAYLAFRAAYARMAANAMAGSPEGVRLERAAFRYVESLARVAEPFLRERGRSLSA